MSMPYRLYLLATLLIAAVVIGGVWAFAASMRLAFMESGYPVVVAKRDLIQACDIGDLVIVGDSRPEAAIMPLLLPVRSANLGVGALSAVETYFIVRRVMQCPNHPRYVVYSHSIEAFRRPGEGLWKRAVESGLLDYRNLREIEAVADSLHDPSVRTISTGDGLTGRVRDMVYAIGFPSIFINSMINGRLVGRYTYNLDILHATRSSRGHVVYRASDAHPIIGVDAAIETFAASPIETYYFRKTLDLLSNAGAKTLFVPIPLAAATLSAAHPQVVVDYERFIRETVRSDHAAVLANDRITAWPDEDFVDGSHMNGPAAKAFSQVLAVCLEKWTADAAGFSGCELAPPSPVSGRVAQ